MSLVTLPYRGVCIAVYTQTGQTIELVHLFSKGIQSSYFCRAVLGLTAFLWSCIRVIIEENLGKWFYRAKRVWSADVLILNRKRRPPHKLYFLKDNRWRQCKTFQEPFAVPWRQSVFKNSTCKTRRWIYHLSNFEDWNMPACFSWLLNAFSRNAGCLNCAVKGYYCSCLNICGNQAYVTHFWLTAPFNFQHFFSKSYHMTTVDFCGLDDPKDFLSASTALLMFIWIWKCVCRIPMVKSVKICWVK